MKRLPSFCLLFLAVSFTSLIACNSSNSSSDDNVATIDTSAYNTTTTSTTSDKTTTEEGANTEKSASVSIDVLDDDDNRMKLNLDQNSILVVLGSWCPHSSNLLKAMTDPQYSKLFEKDKLVFVLDRYEIDNFKTYAASSGEFTQDEIEAASKGLDEIKEYSKIVDPKCLEKLSDYKHYYVDFKKYSLEGVPRCYSDGNLTSNYMQVLADHVYSSNPILFKSFLNYFENLEKSDQ
jgi:hypothetical protein